jgi:lysozyme
MWAFSGGHGSMKRLILILAMVLTLVSNNAVALEPMPLINAGPGSRIHGVDVSRWQHPNERAIDFAKMAVAGVRFVWIKGSDSSDAADVLAKKYLVIDRNAAQQAGLYTGFYYYAHLPDSIDKVFIAADAKAQAQKAVWRLASIGGYTNQDLPIALDIENNCVRYSGSVCKKYMNKKYITLWTTTWLAEVSAKTNRKPVIYSYSQFLETALVRSPELATYPLWIAAYGKDPALVTSQPGTKTVGCFAHSWTKSDCTSNWQIWQYTSCGIAAKYGVPGGRVDLNVFNGDAIKFATLTSGTWQPEIADLLPVNEPTTMQMVSSSFTSTNDPVTFVVDVFRPDGTPVVTGTVDFKSVDTLMPSGIHSIVRSASGRWQVKISGLQAANYVGLVEFTDPSGTHAPSSIPVSFTITQGLTPNPVPSTKPAPKPAPNPVDSCAKQIRN